MTKSATPNASPATQGQTCSVEMTDTFGGEANYSWVRRAEITVTANEDPVRKAKAALGMTGVKCVRSDIGEMIELRPVGSCTVIFITFNY